MISYIFTEQINNQIWPIHDYNQITLMATAVANPLLISNKTKRTSSIICPELCKSLLTVRCLSVKSLGQSLTIRFVRSKRTKNGFQVDQTRKRTVLFLNPGWLSPLQMKEYFDKVFPRIPFVYQANILCTSSKLGQRDDAGFLVY